MALSDRQSKGKLRQQKILLDTALENMSQGLCMFDADGNITLFNERYAKMMGLPAAWLEGRSLLDLFKRRKASGEFAGDPEKFFERVVAEETRQGKFSTRIMQTSGGHALRVVEQPMQGGGWVATFEDITEWQKAQVGLSSCTGDIVVISDIDTTFDRSAFAEMMGYFADPRVGAVSGNIGVRNARVSLITRHQAIEYAINISLGRSIQDVLGILSIVSGRLAPSAVAIEEVGGKDVEVGEDADLTMKLGARGGAFALPPAHMR